MKRRSVTAAKLRDRRGPGIKSPYAKYNKKPWRYSKRVTEANRLPDVA